MRLNYRNCFWQLVKWDYIIKLSSHPFLLFILIIVVSSFYDGGKVYNKIKIYAFSMVFKYIYIKKGYKFLGYIERSLLEFLKSIQRIFLKFISII